MARIVLGSYMVRYPLGGMLSWVLQYLIGFQRLGHDVVFVEKSGYPNSCYDPERNAMSDDCSYGTRVVSRLLARFGVKHWCYVDADDHYHGMTRPEVGRTFDSADVFFDMGTHGAWLREAAKTQIRVLIDGEPGFTQMKMELRGERGEQLPAYDLYYTTGRNVGTASSTAPTAGKGWRPLFHPVVTELYSDSSPRNGGPYTTVMNWQSYEPVAYGGRTYGHKDAEFAKFVDLPGRTSALLEVAVAGRGVPRARLERAGWRVRDAHETTISFDSFVEYVANSRGEFGVCKNGFVDTNSGWFSDRSAVYLASGRPVVLEETGFSAHIPCGEGLFAARSVEEAAAAIEEIESDYERHSRAARELAVEYLDARRVLGEVMQDLGL